MELNLELIALVSAALATVGGITMRLISVIEEQAKALGARLDALSQSIKDVGEKLSDLEQKTILHFSRVDEKISEHEIKISGTGRRNVRN